MSERQVNQAPKEVEISTLKGVICSSSGSRIAPVYKRIFDKDANANVVRKVDEIDLQEFINASASSTDLANLEKRFIALGEIPAVDPSLTGDGIDFTQYPKDIHEVYSMINDIDNNFQKLPDSVQAIFGSKEAYMKSLLDGTYNSIIIKHIKGLQKVPADTSTSAEKGE